MIRLLPVMASDTLKDRLRDFFSRNFWNIIWAGIIIAVALLLMLITNMLVARFIRHQKRRRAATVARLVQSIIRYTLLIIAVLSILSVWGVDIAPILAGAGIVGLAIGLGAQALIRDLVAGISIVFDNYYDVDDIIEIKGYKGRVIEIGLKSTKIIGWRGDVKIFSNGDITEVINYSKNPSVGVVDIDVDYRQDMNKVLSLLEENIPAVCSKFPQILEGPSILGVIKVGANSFTVRIIVKTKSEEHYEVERSIFRAVKELFEKNHIEIAMQRTVVYGENLDGLQ